MKIFFHFIQTTLRSSVAPKHFNFVRLEMIIWLIKFDLDLISYYVGSSNNNLSFIFRYYYGIQKFIFLWHLTSVFYAIFSKLDNKESYKITWNIRVYNDSTDIIEQHLNKYLQQSFIYLQKNNYIFYILRIWYFYKKNKIK